MRKMCKGENQDKNRTMVSSPGAAANTGCWKWDKGGCTWENDWNFILLEIARGTGRYIKRYIFLLLFGNKVVTQLENALSKRLDCNENQERLIYQWYCTELASPGAADNACFTFLFRVWRMSILPPSWLCNSHHVCAGSSHSVQWEAGLLHPTREDLPKKLNIVLISCSGTYIQTVAVWTWALHPSVFFSCEESLAHWSGYGKKAVASSYDYK